MAKRKKITYPVRKSRGAIQGWQSSDGRVFWQREGQTLLMTKKLAEAHEKLCQKTSQKAEIVTDKGEIN